MQWQNKKETIERIGKNLQYYIQKKGSISREIDKTNSGEKGLQYKPALSFTDYTRQIRPYTRSPFGLLFVKHSR